jgi:hypothetical protein
LLVGEGLPENFLAPLLARNPDARVTCVDASARMLEVTRERLLRAALPLERVEFVHAELPARNPPRLPRSVATFFLDCFPREQLAAVINSLGKAARPARAGSFPIQIPEGVFKAAPCPDHSLADVCAFPASRRASGFRVSFNLFPRSGFVRSCMSSSTGAFSALSCGSGHNPARPAFSRRRAPFRGGAARTLLAQALLIRL